MKHNLQNKVSYIMLAMIIENSHELLICLGLVVYVIIWKYQYREITVRYKLKIKKEMH